MDGVYNRFANIKFRRNATVVYFVLAAKAERIKIGSSYDGYRRMEQLQTGCPEELIMMGTITHPNAAILEKELHERFAHLCERGEWFRCEMDLVEFVRDNRDPPHPAEALYASAQPAPPEAAPAPPKTPKPPEGPVLRGRGAKLARYKLARGIA